MRMGHAACTHHAHITTHLDLVLASINHFGQVPGPVFGVPHHRGSAIGQTAEVQMFFSSGTHLSLLEMVRCAFRGVVASLASSC